MIDWNLKGKRIAVPEMRELEVLSALLERRGAEVLRCPLVTIYDSPHSAQVLAFAVKLAEGGFDDFILITGEGLTRILSCIDKYDPALKPRFVEGLGRLRTITRGPKPARALRALGLKPNIEATEPTTEGVIRALSSQELAKRRVAVQLYGNDPNLTLMRFLRERNAEITTVAPYVYGNAADDATVQALLERMAAGEVDAIAFTSKLQIERLMTQHPTPLVRKALTRTLIAAVGPIVAEAIRSHGFEVSSSPEHSWFMKPLVVALGEALGTKRGGDQTGTAARLRAMPTILDAIEHTKRGRLQEAEAIYLKLLSTQPNDADALHYLGVLRMGQRRRDEAIELVSRALKVAPRNAHAWNSLGNMVASTGKLAAAEFAFKSALELQPDFLEALYNLGNLQRRMRKREEALQSFRRVTELNPKLSVAHENIAMLLFRLKRSDEAAAAFKRWSEADPENPIARHMLAAYSNQAPERADDAYVAKLFDQMSGYFDESLQRLGYAAPQLLTSALAEIIPFGEKRLVILDAGVGTGLCGPLLRSSAQKLAGVDLSAGMLAKARERNVYDELHEGELVAFMRAHPNEYDVVISADTLVYFGQLEEAFAAAAGALKAGGILAFTVEAEPAGSAEKHRLNQHGRYSHSADYVRECLAGAGLELLQLEAGVLRREMGSDVQGHVVLARRKMGSDPIS